MAEAVPEILPAAHRRPLLVVGSGPASPTGGLARLGGHVLHFACESDALAWLEEDTPALALFTTAPGPAIAAELRDRGVPIVAGGHIDEDRRVRLLQALTDLER